MTTTPGFYIATHPWLSSSGEQVFKVGHTGCLERRLWDSEYFTCFSQGWYYCLTVETANKDQARLIESGVLHCVTHYRLDGRELVRLPLEQIKTLVRAICDSFKIYAQVYHFPTYERQRPEKNNQATEIESTNSSPFETIVKESIQSLVVPIDQFEALLDSLGDSPQQPYKIQIITLPEQIKNKQADAIKQGPLTLETDETDNIESYGESLLDYEDDDNMSYASGLAPLEKRDYQNQAAIQATRELERAGRTIIQMACRCGKTYVSYLLIDKFLTKGQKVLFLVPGLSLLRQTVMKFWGYGIGSKNMVMIGSDPTVLKLPDKETLEMVTSPALITNRINNTGPLLVISTYQSSPLLSDVFDLAIFDECHRICGTLGPRPFNHILLNHSRPKCLFLTATPRYDTQISMKDTQLFGGIAFRYYLREGIQAGYVNDFEVQLVVPMPTQTPSHTLIRQIWQAMGYLKRRIKNPKMLVFTKNIKQALELQKRGEELQTLSAKDHSPDYINVVGHSCMPRQEILKNFHTFCTSERPAILFNCRLFQEGIEIPDLNAVFFASPRHSPRDIIQTICRPLNRHTDKPKSVVFIPIPPSDPSGDLKRFSTIIPFADALLSEDPSFYEYLLNPIESPYPINCIGAETSQKEFTQILATVRRLVRYSSCGKVDRLTRPERLPWKTAYAELQRTVEICRRYPKNNDGMWFGSGTGAVPIGIYTWYKWAGRQYQAFKKNEPSLLQPHQIQDLEKLEKWEIYGLKGPYPWKESMVFLDKWLAQNGGSLVAIDIHRGGWIGLDATPLERLSGVLTTVSQRDGRSRGASGKERARKGFMISSEEAADLDNIFGKWGLRWRKDRENGILPEDSKGYYSGRRTCIQEAYKNFKDNKSKDASFINEHYPGYPEKHRNQELPRVWEQGLAPPRYSARGGTRALITRGPDQVCE